MFRANDVSIVMQALTVVVAFYVDLALDMVSLSTFLRHRQYLYSSCMIFFSVIATPIAVTFVLDHEAIPSGAGRTEDALRLRLGQLLLAMSQLLPGYCFFKLLAEWSHRKWLRQMDPHTYRHSCAIHRRMRAWLLHLQRGALAEAGVEASSNLCLQLYASIHEDMSETERKWLLLSQFMSSLVLAKAFAEIDFKGRVFRRVDSFRVVVGSISPMSSWRSKGKMFLIYVFRWCELVSRLGSATLLQEGSKRRWPNVPGFGGFIPLGAGLAIHTALAVYYRPDMWRYGMLNCIGFCSPLATPPRISACAIPAIVFYPVRLVEVFATMWLAFYWLSISEPRPSDIDIVKENPVFVWMLIVSISGMTLGTVVMIARALFLHPAVAAPINKHEEANIAPRELLDDLGFWLLKNVQTNEGVLPHSNFCPEVLWPERTLLRSYGLSEPLRGRRKTHVAHEGQAKVHNGKPPPGVPTENLEKKVTVDDDDDDDDTPVPDNSDGAAANTNHDSSNSNTNNTCNNNNNNNNNNNSSNNNHEGGSGQPCKRHVSFAARPQTVELSEVVVHAKSQESVCSAVSSITSSRSAASSTMSWTPRKRLSSTASRYCIYTERSFSVLTEGDSDEIGLRVQWSKGSVQDLQLRLLDKKPEHVIELTMGGMPNGNTEIFSKKDQRQLFCGEILPRFVNLKTLDLKGCRIGASEAKKLAPVLGELCHLEILRLAANPGFGTKGGARALAEQALPKLLALEELDLNSCDLGKEGPAELVAGLRHLTKLERLYLQKNANGPALAKMVIKCGTFLPNLVELNLMQEKNHHIASTSTDAVEATDVWAPCETELLYVESIELGHVPPEEKHALLHFLLLAPDLKTLDLASIDDLQWKRELRELSRLKLLQKLDISKCGLHTGKQAVQATLQLHHLVTLEELILHENKGFGTIKGAKVLAAKLKCLRRLRVLDLKACGCYDAQAAGHLAAAFPHLARLEHLLLYRNTGFGKVAGCHALFESFKKLREAKRQARVNTEQSHRPQRTSHLNVLRSEFSRSDTKKTGIPGLRVLDLGNLNLENEEAALTALDGFQYLDETEHLILSGNIALRRQAVSDDGKAILAGFQRLTKLRQLELKFCDFHFEEDLISLLEEEMESRDVKFDTVEQSPRKTLLLLSGM